MASRGARHAVEEALKRAGIAHHKNAPAIRMSFLDHLDQLGMTVVPKTPTDYMINASVKAMWAHERKLPDGWDRRRLKMALRYSAMIEVHRLHLYPLSTLPDETPSSAGIERAIARAVDRVIPPIGSSAINWSNRLAPTS